ncbi:hypothetical protein N7523_004725 [Penicillium sp. IBT 18751x]|nr:hypothetical protein N7523_004725 [Penicillium sp. IBT 18751x]
MAQGGILGTPSAGQTTTISSSKTATSGPPTTSSMSTSSMSTSSMSTSSMITTSSTSPASGTQTSTGGSSPSATNIADNLHVSTDLSILVVLILSMAMFFM